MSYYDRVSELQVHFCDIYTVVCYVTDRCLPILPMYEPCEFPCEMSHDILMYVESRQKKTVPIRLVRNLPLFKGPLRCSLLLISLI